MRHTPSLSWVDVSTEEKCITYKSWLIFYSRNLTRTIAWKTASQHWAIILMRKGRSQDTKEFLLKRNKKPCSGTSKWKSLSCVRLFEIPWTVALQAPLSMGFSRQGYWSRGCPSFSRGSSWPRDWTQVSCVVETVKIIKRLLLITKTDVSS